MTSFVGTRVKAKELRRQGRSCAAASKHRGQTQSVPDWGSGMGRRKGTAAHQHSPPSPQSKAWPQRAQMILRGVMALRPSGDHPAGATALRAASA